ncbi:ferrous iron transport protein A [Bacteroidia bacterium]|jgi:ferrous iron transport protein A|nr:ferrous iron transport protein A [Bacteroidota bacterium]MDA8929860.1 ferrous iron transport protein A [Bacteroidia bacterium]MDA9111067.1 ferrous iron transport protein A [Bacteroidia bacterium]MDB4173236.1 ferrous iron transport protein A [Bacteroidia bacterium]
MKLSELHIGHIARIVSLDDSPYKEKLQEMGCIPGVLVKPILKAPFGDPIAFELEEYTLSMRKNEADSVLVKPLDPLFYTH